MEEIKNHMIKFIKIRRLIYIILLIILINLSFGIYLFYKTTYLKFELVSKIKNKNEEFYPLAYYFIHSQKEYKNYFDINKDTREMKKYFPNESELNFEKYSYCIFYGKSIKSLSYSYKSTYFDDPSPSYASCRRYGLKYVIVQYNNLNTNNENGIFLYRVNRDERLSGCDGL